jgi:hypothetical protein
LIECGNYLVGIAGSRASCGREHSQRLDHAVADEPALVATEVFDLGVQLEADRDDALADRAGTQPV